MIWQRSFFVLILISLASFHAKATSILILGDSLSAGYNMKAEQSWPTLLPDLLSTSKQPVVVINGSVSGDTTGNGLAKMSGLLEEHQPDYVLIELGANDGLRGFQPNIVKNNLHQLITMSKDAGAKVMLMQIRIPPNYGKRYAKMFEAIYPDLAEETSTPLIPFFLEQVITKPEWMMEDGLHPKAVAQPFIAETIANELRPYLAL
ncbi:arylesterase [Vibrio sp. 10N.286.49.C2]|uniref:arylesterase n=1 Tax=unclassified Vibrio TaxID=2614977 RepID=UPI000C864BAB|nr:MULTISPECIES: arylesterase [unclassified Vibrio]PMH34767.1 arylesterase [Vibrio sp. 10N.286.49.C2]PMH51444.1 arylesterase [Vibrio sp. 10N.286.49.B1]PMH79360.1 arylesterase [Vibrio sp. 10N.286.48.B7]